MHSMDTPRLGTTTSRITVARPRFLRRRSSTVGGTRTCSSRTLLSRFPLACLSGAVAIAPNRLSECYASWTSRRGALGSDAGCHCLFDDWPKVAPRTPRSCRVERRCSGRSAQRSRQCLRAWQHPISRGCSSKRGEKLVAELSEQHLPNRDSRVWIQL